MVDKNYIPKENHSDKEICFPIPGEKSIANLLKTAMQPLGNTMYVWGGGWNESDTGAGIEARSIGVSSRWSEFAAKQSANYDYEETRYQIHDGLDCSGYVGWVVYNVFECISGKSGYVMSAEKMAARFSDMGWGKYTPAEQVKDWKAGDIMSVKGHVWIVVGMCDDGSVVLLHSSPPGVILCGTPSRQLRLHGSKENISSSKEKTSLFPKNVNQTTSQAICLAEKYMRKYYPEWYERFPKCSRSIAYLEASAQMRWKVQIMKDADVWEGKSAEEVLEWMFEERVRRIF